MNLAILNVFKNPLVITVILGSVFVTNAITYNVVQSGSESELLKFMKAEKAEKVEAFRKKSRMVDREPKAPLIDRLNAEKDVALKKFAEDSGVPAATIMRIGIVEHLVTNGYIKRIKNSWRSK